MLGKILLRYPVYIPSKGRYESALTIKLLLKDTVPFFLVVEPHEADAYGTRYGYEHLLVLPWSGDDSVRKQFTRERHIENGGLIAVRNWIKEHATSAGHARHWQLDDNIRRMYRRYRARRIPIAANVALTVAEDFTERYDNIAITGLNYAMFLKDNVKWPPYYVNSRVYSCSLINNAIPHKWRVRYNDDADMCLQVLADGWCTVNINVFNIDKMRTMVVKGGNTDDLYQGDGRLKMARSLERLWPGVVETKRRFRRPQHVIKNAWRQFDTPLKLKPGIDLSNMQPNEYGMTLQQVKPIKSQELREFVATHAKRSPAESPAKKP